MRMQVDDIHALLKPRPQNCRIHAVHDSGIENVPSLVIHVRRQANENMRFGLHLERINQTFEIDDNRGIDSSILCRVIPLRISFRVVRAKFDNYRIGSEFNRRGESRPLPVRRLIVLADSKPTHAKILDRICRCPAVTQYPLQMMWITRIVRPGLNPITVSDTVADASNLARRKRRCRQRRSHRCRNHCRDRQKSKLSHNHEINIHNAKRNNHWMFPLCEGQHDEKSQGDKVAT